METLLEQQRRYHEERERLMDAMCQEALHETKPGKEQINADHRMRQVLDRYMECSNELKDLYQDRDGLRKEELAALSGPNEFAEFYSRLKSVREFHRKHPNEISIPMSMEFDELKKQRENQSEDAIMVDFTDEEGYGKFLDLHECFHAYLNLKGVEKVDYLSFLSNFDKLFDIDKDKKNAAYRGYVELLLEYLGGYVERIKPLLNIYQEIEKLRPEFDSQWQAGTFPGWPKETTSALQHTGAHLDLSSFFTWQELASLGLDRLKSALMALGLKCGGTLEERAKRLFQTKGKTMSEIDPALFAPKAKSAANKSLQAKQNEKQREVALLESQVYYLVELVSEQREATKENVQRKQARTGGERDDSDEEVSDAESEEGEDDIPYNPKNLPLGWDGKPIPYWLYRLHGLNMYFNCEICGNFKYRGPKMFQRHFSEWRHAHGMRCLGIPNTAHFANVTQIEDAIALWQKLKRGKEQERWRPEVEEEFEDTSGNVVNKKTYEDLKRQGLL